MVGATGLLGRDICRRLGAAGKPVRALVRRTADRAKVDELAHALGNSIDMRSTLKTFPVPLVSVKEYARRITQARG